MKSARDMFEELGYEIDEQNENEILYKMKWEISSSYFVGFDLEKENVECFVVSDSPFEPSQSFPIDMNLLQSINKQVEELHWKVD